MKSFRKNKSFFLILSIVLIATLSVGGVLSIFVREMWVQATLLRDIESRYGGLIVGEIHQVGADYHERLTIVDIQAGSAFDLAGINHNDVVMSNETIGDFAKRLDASPGTQIQVNLVPGGQGPPFNQRQSRTVTVIAP